MPRSVHCVATLTNAGIDARANVVQLTVKGANADTVV